MTDRLKGLTVILSEDVRTDDAENLIKAIQQFRGVASVVPHVVDSSDFLNRERIRLELSRKLFEVLSEPGTNAGKIPTR